LFSENENTLEEVKLAKIAKNYNDFYDIEYLKAIVFNFNLPVNV
jgi:hypothetical protein